VQLEGGIIIRISDSPEDKGNCLVMPSGTFHAVLTLRGGVFGGFNYSTTEDLFLSSQMICIQFPRFQHPDQLAEDIGWFHETLKCVLGEADSTFYPVAFYSVVTIKEDAEKHATARKDSRCVVWIALNKLWKDVLQLSKKLLKRAGNYQCACGEAFDNIEKHYSTEPQVQCAVVIAYLEKHRDV
jgi:hypothetical protein